MSRLDDEIQAHLDHLAAEHMKRGRSPEEAHAAARRDFGGVLHMRELCRDQRRFAWRDELQQDVRYAVRGFRRAPGFTAVAVLTLALGIGATTAIFSVVNGVLLRPLPYANPDRIVRAFGTSEFSPDAPARRNPVFLESVVVRELAGRVRALDAVGYIMLSLANWPGHNPRWQGARVSASALEMLGVQPVLGRLFGPADEAASAPGAMILSYTAWQQYFAGEPAVLGQTITIEPVLAPRGNVVPATYTVVGVMPEGFDFLPGARAQFWIAGGPTGGGFLVGRLATGITLDAATADVVPALAALERGGGARALKYEVTGVLEEVVGHVRPALLLLMGAVTCVLLIACVNVASLLMARSVSGQRETAIRAAIGAGRWRLARLAVTESLVMAAVSCALGVLTAAVLVRLLQQLAGTSDRIDLGQGDALIPRLDSVALDATVLLFAGGVSLIAALLFSVAPGVRQFRTPPIVTLRNGSGSTAIDGRHRRIGVRGLLVVGQVALAMMLLAGGALLMVSLARLTSVDAGYDAEGVVTFQVSLPSARFPLLRQREFAESLKTRLEHLPGAAAVAYANQLPMVALRDTAGGLWRTPDPQRRPTPQGPDARIVSTKFFETMGIAVRAGRIFGPQDHETGERVLVVNELLARGEFGGVNAAVGQSVYIGNGPTPWRIVGVVADVRQFGLSREPEAQFFADARQWAGTGPLFPLGAYYAVRVSDQGSVPAAAIEAAVRELEPQAVLFNVAPMEHVVSTTLVRPRLFTVLLVLFAAVGVALACIGIYGVLSYTVAQRTREMGIRMALGARRRVVLGLVIGRSVALTIAGVTVGLVGAVATTRYLETLLFEVEPLDTTVLMTTAVLFLIVAVIATSAPAHRATRVDPLIALRVE